MKSSTEKNFLLDAYGEEGPEGGTYIQLRDPGKVSVGTAALKLRRSRDIM
jgi:hypothetical protein